MFLTSPPHSVMARVAMRVLAVAVPLGVIAAIAYYQGTTDAMPAEVRRSRRSKDVEPVVDTEDVNVPDVPPQMNSMEHLGRQIAWSQSLQCGRWPDEDLRSRLEDLKVDNADRMGWTCANFVKKVGDPCARTSALVSGLRSSGDPVCCAGAPEDSPSVNWREPRGMPGLVRGLVPARRRRAREVVLLLDAALEGRRHVRVV